MTVAELKFLHLWIELEDLYRLPLPLRKIFVLPGSLDPPTKFFKI